MLEQTRIVAALAVALALAAPAAAQETQEASQLAWKLEAGQELYYAYGWKLEQTQEIPDVLPATPSLYQVGYTLTEKVSAVENGVATIDATITSIKVNLSLGMMMGAMMAYDSTAPDDGVNPLRPFRHVVGEGFQFKLGSDGTITDVSGSEGIIKALKEKAQGEVATMGPMGGQLLGLLSVVFSGSALEGSLKIVNEVLPSAPVAEGGSFETSVDMELPTMGRLTFTTENTRGATERGKVTLEGAPKGEIKLEKIAKKDGKGGEAAEMGRQLTEGQEVTRREAKRTAVFSVRHHLLESTEVVLEIDSTGPPPDQLKMMLGENAQDKKMNQTAKLTLTYERSQTPAGE